MSASHDNIAWKGLRRWWANPPRSGFRRWIAPFEYRHLRGWATVRIVTGLVLAPLGVYVIAATHNAWAIFGAYLLAAGLANIVFAFWELSIADSATAQTQA